jgi:hypothetical protein
VAAGSDDCRVIARLSDAPAQEEGGRIGLIAALRRLRPKEKRQFALSDTFETQSPTNS